ncbi:adenylate/guanylate cyclase domain-containing protein [Synechococcus sp. CBW1107]|uniref:adenylate/guanylate cyclase domain-containing protein n=1 Tax=Synechococcus sp. CBW1107 TaxID=2789857 RepID=UPI002AD52FA7|nr:adenylate/guanylate cyclase domain-containing protein [Synechococcus sp. CBW1107]
MSCVFGIQETDSGSYCEDAVKTAFAIRKRILVLSEALRKEFNRSVDVGIGIHYGPTVVENTGPVDDLRFGLVGDCVNIASRIERKTRDFNCDILISQAVWDNLTESGDLIQEKHEVPLKGVSQTMTVYPARIPVRHAGITGESNRQAANDQAATSTGGCCSSTCLRYRPV